MLFQGYETHVFVEKQESEKNDYLYSYNFGIPRIFVLISIPIKYRTNKACVIVTCKSVSTARRKRLSFEILDSFAQTIRRVAATLKQRIDKMYIAAGALLSRSAFLSAAAISSFLADGQTLNVEDYKIFRTVSDREKPQSTQALQKLSTSIRRQTSDYINEDPTLAGPFIRLAFHDACTLERIYRPTGGPNGSIQFELQESENRGLGRPIQIAQDVCSANGGGSFADTIALMGAQAIEDAGGPHIAIRMGRPDTSKADPMVLIRPLKRESERSLVTRTMPFAGFDSDGLRLYFRRFRLSDQELVALSGIHGLGRHVSLLNMNKTCLKTLTRTCLEDAPTLLPFVTSSVDRFSNEYFSFLLKWNNRQVQLGEVAFIPTDVALVVDRKLRRHVINFANDEQLFYRTFTRAYQKLVDSTATSKQLY